MLSSSQTPTVFFLSPLALSLTNFFSTEFPFMPLYLFVISYFLSWAVKILIQTHFCERKRHKYFFYPFLPYIAHISVFASQMVLLGFYHNLSLFYLSHNKSPVSRVTPSHWERESAHGGIGRRKKKKKEKSPKSTENQTHNLCIQSHALYWKDHGTLPRRLLLTKRYGVG